MDTRLTPAIEALKKEDIIVDHSSITKHGTQGYISEVYTAASNIGRIVLHVMTISPAQEHMRTWEKLIPLSRLLKNDPLIPVSHIFFAQKLGEHFIVAQTLLEGSSAGERRITKHDYEDVWYRSFERHDREIEKIIAAIHTVPISGFGWLRAGDNGLMGEHETWQAFLNAELPIWVHAIDGAEKIRGSQADGLTEKIERFLEEVMPRIQYSGRPSLVHYDLINPSNILLQDDRVSGIIDWEYAVAADPAWEFTYKYQYRLEEYFSHFPEFSEEAKADFKNRADLYGYICFMLWSYSQSWKPESALYDCVRTILLERLSARGN